MKITYIQFCFVFKEKTCTRTCIFLCCHIQGQHMKIKGLFLFILWWYLCWKCLQSLVQKLVESSFLRPTLTDCRNTLEKFFNKKGKVQRYCGGETEGDWKGKCLQGYMEKEKIEHLTLFSVISREKKDYSDITELMSCSLFHQQHPGCAFLVCSINLSWSRRERMRLREHVERITAKKQNR